MYRGEDVTGVMNMFVMPWQCEQQYVVLLCSRILHVADMIFGTAGES